MRGCYICFEDVNKTSIAGGATIYEKRLYEFKVPKCFSPAELAVKLDLDGWTPPKRISGKWKLKHKIPANNDKAIYTQLVSHHNGK